MILSIFFNNYFFPVLAATSSSFIYASLICLSISLLYHFFSSFATVRCFLNNRQLIGRTNVSTPKLTPKTLLTVRKLTNDKI